MRIRSSRSFPFLIVAIFSLILNFESKGQDSLTIKPKLFIAGGAMPESLYEAFAKLTNPTGKLVVIPTATGREVDEMKIKEQWNSRGFESVTVLHTRDREVSSSEEFSKPLKEATTVWISGGSQYRIADAYLDTPVEKELYQLVERGGIIGGSSAGAAIQTKVMIKGGNPEPEMAEGFDLFSGAIVDQHFLKRNRIPRLMAAIQANPELTGFGIDEGTAIVVYEKEYRIVGESYVLRIQLEDGAIKMDAFEAGDVISLTDN